MQRLAAGHRLDLHAAGGLEADEVDVGLGDGRARGDQAVVAQDHVVALAEVGDQPRAFLEVEGRPLVFVIGEVVHEPERVLVQRQQSFAGAKAMLLHAEAEDAKLKAGAWAEDISVAKAEVERMKALVEQTRVELDRLQVKAPIDDTMLKSANCRL